MKNTVTLKELIAILIRRGKLLIVFVLAFALILGGYRLSGLITESKKEENAPEKIEERYQDARSLYEDTKIKQETLIQAAEDNFASQQEHNENSLLMQIDPYSVVSTTIDFSIVNIEEQAFDQSFRIDEIPVDFIVTKIQNQYLAIWNGADLQKLLKEDLEDKYLREVITLDAYEGGVLSICARGLDAEQTEQYAEAVYAYLQSKMTAVTGSSYDHDFSLLNKATKVQMDEELKEAQKLHLENLQLYTQEIEKQIEALGKLNEPVKESGYGVTAIVKSVIKYAVLGGVIGFIFGFVWIILVYLFREKMEMSCDMTALCGAPMLGSAKKKQDAFGCWADKLLGERVWMNSEEAAKYLVENIRLSFEKGEKVAILTTLSLGEDAEEVKRIKESFAQNETTVQFVNRADYNADTLKCIGEGATVVLAERCGVSRMAALKEVAALVKKWDVKVKGCILI